MVFNFADRNWQSFPRDKLDELKISHNELWYNTATQVGALLIRQSNQYSEHAMSVAGLHYLAAALEQKKITAGFVVAVNRNRIPVCSKPSAEVAAMLEGVPPRTGRFGDFYWLNSDLTLNDDWQGGVGQVWF
jgi:hypothetical protein